MKNKLFLFFNKQAVIMEETQMVQMTGDRVKRVALETIEPKYQMLTMAATTKKMLLWLLCIELEVLLL